MYFLVDVIAIAFVLFFTLYGLKAGFTKSTLDVVLVLGCVAGAGLLAYFCAVWFTKIGWTNEFQSVILRLFGNSKISGAQPIIEKVCYWIAFAFFVLISFIVCYIVLSLLRKLLVSLIKKFNGLAVFGVLDKVLGVTVNLAVTAGIVLCLMALFFALAKSGKYAYGDEVLRASEVLSHVHKINPLNSIFAGIFGA
ncbi:MAG: CvpA family protein [Clostridia bacterium]|nr:CvpA family protein [Clostridia bacterium]